jgi:hypothetical protein
MRYQPPEPEQSGAGIAEAIVGFIVCVIALAFLISLVL